jgi:hypothetical protein
MARYQLLRPGSAHIDNQRLGGYIEAAALDVVHDESLSPDEKVGGLVALAALSRDLGDHWTQTNRYYGQSAERIWHRMCGLTPEGQPQPEHVARAQGLPEPDYEGRHRAEGGGEDA